VIFVAEEIVVFHLRRLAVDTAHAIDGAVVVADAKIAAT
jgi:hypothetical protein